MTSGSLSFGQDINQEELDFADLFLYNPPAEDFPGCDTVPPLQNTNQPPLLAVDNQSTYVSTSNETSSAQNLSSNSLATETLSVEGFETPGLTSRPGNIPAPSPRIEITPSGDSLSSQNLEPSSGSKALGIYRECVSPASSNSSTGWPAETYSPLASPCVSPNGGACGTGLSALDLCPGLQAIHTSSAHSSPGASPRTSITEETFLLPQHQRTTSPLPHQRSRSSSPKGKRTYDQVHSCQGISPVQQRSRSPSPKPSPHEQQGTYYVHNYQAQDEFHHQPQTSSMGLEEILSSLNASLPREKACAMVHSGYSQAQGTDCVYGDGYDWNAKQDWTGRVGAESMSEIFYMVPTVWPPPPHPALHGTLSGLSVAPLPSLEWPLPSRSSEYELLIQQQPRSHHRAHYETEGSRGAVKTSNGGNPEVQLRGYQGTAPLGLQVFIGTADERLLKPHAFYQVHRVTGRTVNTPSRERTINGTKVLEILLDPKNHMRVVIDCVGILKLRNADIELRNGETDIGRKNTRVRLVFRIHVPQPGEQLVSLQVASDPIECSQRSAQELPAVERQDLDRSSVLGGQQMVLTGQNFTSDSKVIFSEKTQDGQQIWEVEATVDRDKTQANMLFVEVPPYRDPTICHPAKVNFYVINGKKKRSQPQHFIYTPMIAIKAEPLDEYQLNSYGCLDHQSLGMSMKESLCHRLAQDSSFQALQVSPALYHRPNLDPRAHRVIPEVYQSRADTLVSSPALYHTGNQRYTNCGVTCFTSPSLAFHPTNTSTANQCVSPRTSAAKLSEDPPIADPFEACLVSRHHSFSHTVLPLGKSPPSRYFQGDAEGEVGCRLESDCQLPTQRGSNRVDRDDPAPHRIAVKQENLSYAYLEDVNDIIRRDLKGHSGE